MIAAVAGGYTLKWIHYWVSLSFLQTSKHQIFIIWIHQKFCNKRKNPPVKKRVFLLLRRRTSYHQLKDVNWLNQRAQMRIKGAVNTLQV